MLDNDGNTIIPENTNKTSINKIKSTYGHENELILSSIFSSYLNQRFTVSTANSSSGEETTPDFVAATELDSHADSPVVGINCAILEDTGKTAKVSGFTSELGKPITVPIVKAAVAYDCEYTAETHILVIHYALYFRNMNSNLIPPS